MSSILYSYFFSKLVLTILLILAFYFYKKRKLSLLVFMVIGLVMVALLFKEFRGTSLQSNIILYKKFNTLSVEEVESVVILYNNYKRITIKSKDIVQILIKNMRNNQFDFTDNLKYEKEYDLIFNLINDERIKLRVVKVGNNQALVVLTNNYKGEYIEIASYENNRLYNAINDLLIEEH